MKNITDIKVAEVFDTKNWLQVFSVVNFRGLCTILY